MFSIKISSNPIILPLSSMKCSNLTIMKDILFFSAIFSLSVGCASKTGQDSGSHGIGTIDSINDSLRSFVRLFVQKQLKVRDRSTAVFEYQS